MAYKEVSRVEVTEIIRRWQAGEGIRALARATGLSRNTVSKYMAAAEGLGLTRNGPSPDEAQLIALVQLNANGPRHPKKPSEETLAVWSDRIREWLEKDRLQLTRIHELMGGKGCGVSYMSLRRYVDRHGWRPGKQGTVPMADTKPGEMAEMDFGRLGRMVDPESGRLKTVWALAIVLGYSRHCFVWPLVSQKLGDIIEGLEAAWAFFGGIPRYLIPDMFRAT
jgi:transposase